MMMCIVRFLVPLLVFFWSLHCYAQKAGEIAPDFTLTKLFHAPADAPLTLSGLKGNVVVLDFWATWCAPCLVSMKKFDTIAKKLSDKPIKFLAISKEPIDRIENFIKTRPGNLWIGVDGNEEANQRYGVDEIPHLVIIDKQGIILGVTRSDEVTEERLLQVLEGKKVDFPTFFTADEFEEREKTIFQQLSTPKVIFKPFNARGGSTMLFNAFFPKITDSSFFAITILPLIVQEAFGISKDHIRLMDLDMMREKYYAHIQLVGQNMQNVRDTLKNLLMQYIEIKIDKNLLKEKVIVLQRVDSTQSMPFSSSKDAQLQYSDVDFRAKKQPITALVTYLQSKYGQQKIVDRTGLSGEYDLVLSWNNSGGNGLKEALRRAGFILQEAEQAIDAYVLYRKGTSD